VATTQSQMRKTTLFLLFLLLNQFLVAQINEHPLSKSRPSDFEYLSAPDSLGYRMPLKTPSVERTQNLKLPYPIIFIHGLNSNSLAWDITTNWMDSQYGLTFGGRFDYCLNFDANNYNSNTNFYPTANADLALFAPTIFIPGDYYYLNFDVGYNGSFHPTSLSADYALSDQSSIVKQGIALKWAIYDVLQITGRDKVILMGHSMGGLAAREYLQNQINWQPDGQTHVAKLVTTGTPHGGSNSTAFGFGGVTGLDEQSEAIRDLRRTYYYSLDNGVYLYGGLELQNNTTNMDDNLNLSGIDFYSVDVNCNGTIGNTIVGLNQKNIYTDVDYSCIVGECPNCLLDIYQGDGVVNNVCANLNNYYTNIANVYQFIDNNASTEIHTSLPEQNYQNMQGLDEPNEYLLSYNIDFDTSYTAFTTMQPTGGYPFDYDDFKFTLAADGNVTININNIGLGNLMAQIVDLSFNTIGTVHNSNGSLVINFSELLTAGDYYLEIYGTPTLSSYLYPYDFILQQTNIATEINSVSIPDILNIYPNPFNNKTTVYFSEFQKQTKIEITDMLGNVISTNSFSGKEFTIEKDAMTAGVYFLQVSNDKKNFASKKIIVN
jgi:pimeloyl-ACP methyl ester carboxylesterase